MRGSTPTQAVWSTDTGVDASTILTYGQSLDPSSPWYDDQTRMFSQEQWVDFPFTDAQITSSVDLTGGPDANRSGVGFEA